MIQRVSNNCRRKKLMGLGFILFLTAFIAIGCGSDGGSSDSSATPARAYDNSDLYGVYRVNLKIGKCESGELLVTIGNDPGRNDENYIYVPETSNSITKQTNAYSYVCSVSNDILSVIKKYNDGDIMDVDFAFNEDRSAFTMSGIITGNETIECSGEAKGDAVKESSAIDEEMPAELIHLSNADNVAWNLYLYVEPEPVPAAVEEDPDEEPASDPPPVLETPYPRGNFAPVLKPIGYKIARVGSEIKFPLIAMDENRDVLEFSAYVNVPKNVLDADGDAYLVYRVKRPLSYIGQEPFGPGGGADQENARLVRENGTMYFTWTPKRAYDDVELIFTVTDDGEPVRSDSETIRIKVYSRNLSGGDRDLDIGLYAYTSLPSTITMTFSVTTVSGDPVPGMTIDNFSVLENSNPLHPTEANLTAFPAPERYEAMVLLMLDLSGSITSSPARLANLIQTAKEFVSTMTKNIISTKIAIYSFTTPDSSHRVTMLSDFTNETAFLHAVIDRLSEHVVVPGASTNLYRAFAEGIEILDSVAPATDHRKAGHLVVLLDGKDTSGIGSYTQARNYVGRCSQKVYPIAFQSEDLDSGTLAEMKEFGSLCGKNRFKLVRDGNDNKVMLATSFKETAAEIIWDSSKYYVVKFCTPMRHGRLIPQLDIVDPITRTGTKAYTSGTNQLITDGFYDGCYSIVEMLKYKYYDFDGDHYLAGADDCNDADPYNWSKCNTCRDADADGFGGSNCDVNSDFADDNNQINPNMVDIAQDGIDSNCDGQDGNFYTAGIEEEIQSPALYTLPAGRGITTGISQWRRLTGYFPATFGQQFGYFGFTYPVPFDATLSFTYQGQSNWNYKTFYFGFDDLVWAPLSAPNAAVMKTGAFTISAGTQSLYWGCLDSPSGNDASGVYVWDITFDRQGSNDVDHDGDGITVNGGDCNDDDPTVFPGALEIPEDGIDQDCSGSDLLLIDFDHDGDEYSERQGDCNDNDPNIYPHAPIPSAPRYIGVDHDCDGVLIPPEYGIDNDGDGYSELQGDCNDANHAIHPGAFDVPEDGIDQDCNGSDLLWVDFDDDGDGFNESQGDCDDTDDTIYPGAPEVPEDGIDQDCNGSDLLWADYDDDADGFTENQGDCDDTDDTIYPGALEIPGDGIDQDCSGSDLLLEDSDDDGDGFTENQGDCDDTADTIYPGAPEIPDDGVDQDCNGSDLLWADVDIDGDGWSYNEGDCNDANPAIYPGHGCP